jgi:hypothetical protein
MVMVLESLVLSRDWQEISVLECILGSLHIGVDVETNPEAAHRKLGRSKIDALIVDCEVHGASDFLDSLPKQTWADNPIPVMVIKERRTAQRIKKANFEFEKPISVEAAVRTLSAARNMILEGRLRYHRQALEAPVTLNWRNRRLGARLVNISRGGVGVRLTQPVEINGAVELSFRLPSAKRLIRASGKVAWCDVRGYAGLRFLELAPSQQQVLQRWLAGRYFDE